MILFFAFVLVVFVAAVRIILWAVLPRAAVAWIDWLAGRLVAGLAGVGVVGLAGFFVWAFTRSPTPADAERAPVVQAAPAAFPASPWERRHPSNLGK